MHKKHKSTQNQLFATFKSYAVNKILKFESLFCEHIALFLPEQWEIRGVFEKLYLIFCFVPQKLKKLHTAIFKIHSL